MGRKGLETLQWPEKWEGERRKERPRRPPGKGGLPHAVGCVYFPIAAWNTWLRALRWGGGVTEAEAMQGWDHGQGQCLHFGLPSPEILTGEP